MDPVRLQSQAIDKRRETMKKASCILLAMMLIAALFVSCKAEVIDDSDLLVNVTFSSDDNSKGLTWSRDFNPEEYTWYYEAEKIDGGPQTGTTKDIGKTRIGKAESNETGLDHNVGPFSIGDWKFTLYGYKGTREADESNLVFQGTNPKASLSKNNASAVKVVVDSISTGSGYILISKDIKLKDGAGNTFEPTNLTIKTASDTDVLTDEFNMKSDMEYPVSSGSYAVTLEMKGNNSDNQEVVYSSTTIYINVYNGQTTTIGGSLDDVKVSTRFEADDGIGGTSGAVVKGSDGSTILTVAGVTPLNSGDTTVVFPKNSISTPEKATLKVVAYSTTSAISKKFGVSDGEDSPISGIDLSLTIDGKNVETFKGNKVTVTTYVATGLVSGTEEVNGETAAEAGLSLKYYRSDAAQPEIVSYNPETGKLVFTTPHFSLYYVTSSSSVAVNETTGTAYTSLKTAVEAVKDGEKAEIVLLKDVDNGDGILIPEGNKNITIDFNGKKYTAFEKNNSSNSKERNAFEFRKGNSIKLKNGTLTTAQRLNVTLIKNYCNLTLESFMIEGHRDEDNMFAVSALSCNYGATLITGKTIILNTEGGGYNKTAIDVNYLPDDGNYNAGELSVSFDNDFSGEIVGSIYFQSKLVRPVEKMVDYTHSLKIDSKISNSFEKANLVLQNIRSKSFFKIKENLISKEKIKTSIKLVDDGEGFKVFDKDSRSILNKTIDLIYTDDLRQAVINAKDGDELVLLKNCVLAVNPVEINSKKIIIDLNGNKITAGSEFEGTDGMIKVDSGTLIVNDSCPEGVKGSIDATIIKSIGVAIKAIKKATITINGGIIKGITSAVEKNADSTSTPKNNSTIRITGGTFNSDPTAYVDTNTHVISKNESAGTWTVTAKN